MDTRVYLAHTGPLEEENLYRLAEDLASPRRKEAAARFRLRADRVRSYAAELLLRKALADRGVSSKPPSDRGICGSELRYGFSGHGKPYLTAPEAIPFNLSHSGDYVMCAVSDEEIGCDVEQIRAMDPEIARRFFHPAEYEAISSAPTPELANDLFFRYWTLKESFLKATGLGITFPLNAFRIAIGPEGEISVEQSADRRNYSFAEIDGAAGYRCAVAKARPSVRVQTDFVDLRELLYSP